MECENASASKAGRMEIDLHTHKMKIDLHTHKMKIDLHTHIIPEHWPDWNKEFGYGGWLTIRHDNDGAKLINEDGSLFRAVDRNCWCPMRRLEECDATGVTMQV